MEQALQKLRHYCQYQERCHSEVRDKLYELGIRKSEHDKIIATLIEENQLNEERFALAFASGKFRIKQWGSVKIKYLLSQKGISSYCIKKALSGIDDVEYNRVLKKLAEEKYALLKSDQHLVRKKKTMDYLMQKGYESEKVRVLVSQL